MAPVETNLADHQSGENALPQRPGCDSSLHAVGDDGVGTQRGKGKRKGEQQARYQAAYEIIAQILSKALAEEFLRMQREQPLQRHKDQGEKQQPRAKSGHVDQQRKKVLQIQEIRQGIAPRVLSELLGRG